MSDQTINNEKKLKAEIVKTLGLEAVPEDQRDELVSKLTETLVKRIFVETTDKLDDEGLEEYKRLLKENASEEAMLEFLESKIPEYNAFVRGVSEDFFEMVRKSAE